MEKKYHVGDIFKIVDKTYNVEKIVLLTRAIYDQESFFLVSINSMEPWNERALSFENRYESTALDDEEIQYLANCFEFECIGNIHKYKNELNELLTSNVTA